MQRASYRGSSAGVAIADLSQARPSVDQPQESAMLRVPTAVPFNDLKRLYARFAPEIESEIARVLASGWWISGRASEAFAVAFAELVGVRHCIPVANGTDALEIALRIAKAPGGRTVVTVANAGGYTSCAARQVGLIPVFADIDRSSLTMSIPSAVEQLGADTAAVVATHLFGNVVDVPVLRREMNAKGFEKVPIIEDCSQAHGAVIGSRRVGSFGDLATFSFYPTKNLGAVGDAGAIVTSDDTRAEMARHLKQYGWTEKYCISVPGGRNSRMDEVQAAVLGVILPHLDALNAERAELREAYLARLPRQVGVPTVSDGAVVHLLPVLVEDRNDLRRFLADRGISTDIHYPILDCDQPGWRDLSAEPRLENSRWAASRIVSIPCFVGMTGGELDAVCDALDAYYGT